MSFDFDPDDLVLYEGGSIVVIPGWTIIVRVLADLFTAVRGVLVGGAIAASTATNPSLLSTHYWCLMINGFAHF